MTRGVLSARALAELLGQWRTAAPAYEALADRIRLLVVDGRISADVRLPAERELAERLALSRTTITAAYRRLREAGYAHSVQGSGTTTALPRVPSTAAAELPAVLDLTKAALPATRYLPEALRAAIADLGPYLADSGYESLGVPELRRALAARYTARGLPTEPEQLIITTGAQGAIALLARTLLHRGDRVWAESPSYPHALDALRDAGGRLVTTPVTAEEGWDLEALEAAFRRTAPALAYTMPDFHNPTSQCMTVDQRQRLLRAAAAVDALVIADETTAVLDIDREHDYPLLGVMGADAGARVIHIGSASKLFWGGLRVGWIRATPELVNRLTAARTAVDMGTPILEQLVVARLLAREAEVVEERREQLSAGRDAIRQAVAELLPEWTLPSTLEGGLAAWIGLGAPVSSQLALAARSRGLLITAGPRFGVDGAFERHLRIPITLEPAVLRDAIGILAEAWPTVSRYETSGLVDLGSVA